MSAQANDDVKLISAIIHDWAEATRTGQNDKVLSNHSDNVLIYDVMPPLKYTNAADYKESWDEWQPNTIGENIFKLHDLVVKAGDTVAYAHCLIQCGGTFVDGKTFEDWVRATICLEKQNEHWTITHQHISAPVGANT